MDELHLIALLVALVGFYLVLAIQRNREDIVERELIHPAKRRRELARREVMYELMDEQICRKNLRMSPNAFTTLCELLRGTGLIRDNQYSYVEEQVAKCLHVLAHGTRSSLSSLLYRRSNETVSRHFHQVLRAIISLEDHFLIQPDGRNVPTEIKYSGGRFFPYFENCVGAIDGTHIRVKVLKEDVSRYRGRKFFPTINVLAACSLDLRFTYVLPGWEGSASDSRILDDALRREDKLIVSQDRLSGVQASLDVEGTGECENEGKGHIRWTGEMDRVMLEVLREQKTKGQKNDRNFTNHAYSTVCEALKKQFNVKLSTEKLQNRLKTLKKDLGLALDLITKKSGFTWDDTKKKIVASNDLWANVIKAQKSFNQIRDKELNNLDLLREIYEKDRATGTEAESAKEKLRRWQNEATRVSIDELDQMQARQEIHLENFDPFAEVSPLTNSKGECSSSGPKPKSKTLKRKAAPIDTTDEMSELKDAIVKIAQVLESAHPPTRSEEEIVEELGRMGFVEERLADAIEYLMFDPRRVKTLFTIPLDIRANWLSRKMND